jgi:hypothetical protein
MELRVTANSFDLFDTLVSRRCIHPQRVFDDVERALGAGGFSAVRIAAEETLRRGGRTFDLHDIYREIVVRGQCSAESAEKLKAAEIDAEFDHAVPVAENLARVREFDLVVSDMYLPADVLRRLLQHVGLRVFVHLFVSYAGKHSGTIWPQIGERWLIQRHLGDNLHADVEGPRRHGIATEHYAGAQLSQAEQLLVNHGLLELAGIVRALRLRNPFPAGTAEAQLWLLYAQLNLPFLILSAAAIRRTQLEHGRAKILFSARDCYFLSEIFSFLHPAVPVDYLHVSRHVLWNDRVNVSALFEHQGGTHALVVDIASTGYSWLQFAEAMKLSVDFCTVVHIDRHEPTLLTSAQLIDSRCLRFSRLLQVSALTNYSNAIEVLNTAPHCSTRSLVRSGQLMVPELASAHELDGNVVAALVAAHAAALELVRKGRGRLLDEMPKDNPTQLLQTLVQTISVQPLLVELGKGFV